MPQIAGLLPAPKIAGLLPPPKVDVFEAIRSIDDSPIWGRIEMCFSLIDEVEALIETYIRKHPDKASRLWDCFMLIQPSDGLWQAPRQLQMSHAKELLDRVVDCGNLTRPTYAEGFAYLLRQMKECVGVVPIALSVGAFQEAAGGQWASIHQSLCMYMLMPQERYRIDEQRWFTRVTDERKAAIFGDAS